MGNTAAADAGSAGKTTGQQDAERLAGLLASVEAFSIKADAVRSAGMMQKAAAAEAALIQAAELLRKMALITHQYAGRAAQLENRIIELEGVTYGD